MNIIQSQMQKYCLMGLMNALMVGGAIASSGGYASAQSQVLRKPGCITSASLTKPCNVYTPLYKDVPLCMPPASLTKPCNVYTPQYVPHKDVPHSSALEIDLILILYPQAIAALKKEDPFAVQRLRLGDLATIQRLEQLAPGSTLRLKSSLPVIQQPQQLNQLNPYLQPQQLQPQQLNQPVIAP